MLHKELESLLGMSKWSHFDLLDLKQTIQRAATELEADSEHLPDAKLLKALRVRLEELEGHKLYGGAAGEALKALDELDRLIDPTGMPRIAGIKL